MSPWLKKPLSDDSEGRFLQTLTVLQLCQHATETHWLSHQLPVISGERRKWRWLVFRKKHSDLRTPDRQIKSQQKPEPIRWGLNEITDNTHTQSVPMHVCRHTELAYTNCTANYILKTFILDWKYSLSNICVRHFKMLLNFNLFFSFVHELCSDDTTDVDVICQVMSEGYNLPVWI